MRIAKVAQLMWRANCELLTCLHAPCGTADLIYVKKSSSSFALRAAASAAAGGMK